MMISGVPMPTTEHRHHIRWEPNNLSHWSLIEQLERAWLEFLEQHESAIKSSQSKVFPQTENLNAESRMTPGYIRLRYNKLQLLPSLREGRRLRRRGGPNRVGGLVLLHSIDIASPLRRLGFGSPRGRVI